MIDFMTILVDLGLVVFFVILLAVITIYVGDKI